MGGLPTGTVSFLFTDIEGSTRRWQSDPAMPEALARHDELIRAAVEDHDGQVLKHTGDGALAVFAVASQAVAAAVAAQRALTSGPWPSAPLRVRMAVHSGEAVERDGDYFGPSPTWAARLMGAAHGSQILVSGTTHALVADHLADAIEMVDLGPQRLRDIDEPVAVFQVVAEGLERDFPPLAKVSTPPVRLPEPRTSFVGRERDLEQLPPLVAQRRLLTLVGVGGAGKTRLAIEAAGRAAEAFPDGVVFVDLSATSDGDGIRSQIAASLGLPPPSARPPGSIDAPDRAVSSFLRSRRLLLVVDNCEHVVDDCAAVLDGLLGVAPGLTVLATSREALALEGEQVWPVKSLGLPAVTPSEAPADEAEAVRLLVDRMRAVAPELTVDAAAREALEEICRRLDGIPLALELAAARAGHLSPAEIAARLDDRFQLLSAGGRGRAERQQTLRATIDWSHDLLSPDEQLVFRRLSVFAGDFTLEATEGICLADVSTPAVDVLASLVQKSMVDRVEGGPDTRYRLLETIRAYGEDRLIDAGEVEAGRSAHRDWYLGRLESRPWDRCLLGRSAAAAASADVGNLRAATNWCEAENRLDLLRRLLVRLPVTLDAREGAALVEQFQRVIRDEQTMPPREHRAWLVDQFVRQALAWGGQVADDDEVDRALQAVLDDADAADEVHALACLVTTLRLMVFPRRGDEMLRSASLGLERADPSGVFIWWLKGFSSIAHLYRRDFESALGVLAELEDAPTDAVGALWGHGAQLRAALVVLGRADEAVAVTVPSADVTTLMPELAEGASETVALAAAGWHVAARKRARVLVEELRSSGWHQPLAAHDCLIAFVAIALFEGDPARAARLSGAVTATSVPALWVMLRHLRDLMRDRLDDETRRRCTEEGRRLDVDAAIDGELARWVVEPFTTG